MATSGSLRLTVIEARFTRDTSTFSGMDPYVKIAYRYEEFQTTAKEGKTPEWEETFDIDIKYIGDDMVIQAYDKCMEGDDKVSSYLFLS